MARDSPKDAKKTIDSAIEALSSDNADERAQARTQLLKQLPLAVPALQKSAQSKDAKVAARAQEMLNDIQREKLQNEKLVGELDIVEAGEFMLQGEVQSAEIRVKTKQFGESALKVEQILSMKSISTARSRGEFSLDAAKYSDPTWSHWYDTGITVTKGEPLEIVAEGQIDHWPEQSRLNTSSSYMSGPEGNEKPTRPPPSGVDVDPRFSPTRFQSGMIVGKIGERGPIFPIGKSYLTKSAPATGTLYLIITPTFWGKPAAGTFDVNVKIDR